MCQETCDGMWGGGRARCMCVSCLCGREPVPPRSAGAARGHSSAAGAAGCPDVPSSPAVPTAQLPRPRLSFLGRGEGTLLRLLLASLQMRHGCEGVMFHVGVGDVGPELESGSDQVCPMCHPSNSGHHCCSYSCKEVRPKLQQQRLL